MSDQAKLEGFNTAWWSRTRRSTARRFGPGMGDQAMDEANAKSTFPDAGGIPALDGAGRRDQKPAGRCRSGRGRSCRSWGQAIAALHKRVAHHHRKRPISLKCMPVWVSCTFRMSGSPPTTTARCGCAAFLCQAIHQFTGCWTAAENAPPDRRASDCQSSVLL